MQVRPTDWMALRTTTRRLAYSGGGWRQEAQLRVCLPRLLRNVKAWSRASLTRCWEGARSRGRTVDGSWWTA